jgi:hypothetical protein
MTFVIWNSCVCSSPSLLLLLSASIFCLLLFIFFTNFSLKIHLFFVDTISLSIESNECEKKFFHHFSLLFMHRHMNQRAWEGKVSSGKWENNILIRHCLFFVNFSEFNFTLCLQFHFQMMCLLSWLMSY